MMTEELKESVEIISTAASSKSAINEEKSDELQQLPYDQTTLSNNIKLVIFSFFTTNEMLCKISKLSKATRQLLSDNKKSEILQLECINIESPEEIKAFDDSYLINFAPMINLTLRCKGQGKI